MEDNARRPSEHDICAIVVTYNPGAETLENLSKLRPQVGRIVIVDNGSKASSLRPLHEASRELSLEIIENLENKGVATALNVGINRARLHGFPWVALFDQDSQVMPDFMKTVLDLYAASPDQDRIGIVSGRYLDMRTNLPVVLPQDGNGKLEAVISSGSIMPMAIFDKCGMFAEELFIDYVDVEYCLRIRRKGFQIAVTEQPVLHHTLGSPTLIKVFGFPEFTTPNYGGRRLYYRSRNRIWMVRKFASSFPKMHRRALRLYVREIAQIAVGEKGSLKKIGYILYGIWDGLAGRMGKTVSL
jgi:rhamnosyltransferase